MIPLVAHHPLIAARPLLPVERPPGFEVGFLGTLTRRAFVEGMGGNFAPHDAPLFTPHYPAFDEEYFEWIALFESVADARDAFTFVELGAGYGRWCVRAALAARGLRFQCVAVEAEPQHCLWLRDHFVDNGLSPTDHAIRRAAVSGDPAFVAFVTGQPDSWYGQSIRKPADIPYPSIADRRELMTRSVNGAPEQPSPVVDRRLPLPRHLGDRVRTHRVRRRRADVAQSAEDCEPRPCTL